jgi:hypothetical protein
MLLFSLFIIDPNLLLRHFLRIPAPISGDLYILSVFACHGGLQPPFTSGGRFLVWGAPLYVGGLWEA